MPGGATHLHCKDPLISEISKGIANVVTMLSLNHTKTCSTESLFFKLCVCQHGNLEWHYWCSLVMEKNATG